MQGKAIVAGGAGFIGSHLCRALLDSGLEVVCLDNLSTGRRNSLVAVLDDPRFTFVEADVRNLSVLDDVDWIFNLACPASPRHYQLDPVGTLMTSVEGTRRLLKHASMCGARLLLASTSEVYGSPMLHPQEETHWGNVNPVGPRACYDEGKRCAETLCMDFRRTRATSVRIARIFNTYGPGMGSSDGRVIPTFVDQARSGRPLTLYGDGLQTRSFCYVDDLVAGLIALMAHDDDGIGPINLGNPEEVRMLDLAERILQLTASRSEIRLHPLPEDDPPRRCPDVAMARRLLGWAPRIGLDDGLARLVGSSRHQANLVRA